jgi:hypothetical protein
VPGQVRAALADREAEARGVEARGPAHPRAEEVDRLRAPRAVRCVPARDRERDRARIGSRHERARDAVDAATTPRGRRRREERAVAPEHDDAAPVAEREHPAERVELRSARQPERCQVRERDGRRAVGSQDVSALDEVELRVRSVERVVEDPCGKRAGEVAARVAEAELAAPTGAGQEIAGARPAERVLPVRDLPLGAVEIRHEEPRGVAVREGERVSADRQRADLVGGGEAPLRPPQALVPAADHEVSALELVPSPVGGIPARARRHRRAVRRARDAAIRGDPKAAALGRDRDWRRQTRVCVRKATGTPRYGLRRTRERRTEAEKDEKSGGGQPYARHMANTDKQSAWVQLTAPAFARLPRRYGAPPTTRPGAA